MVIVRLDIPGKLPGYLKSTIWTTSIERADRFPNKEAAKVAIEKAKKFMMKSHVKHITIVSGVE